MWRKGQEATHTNLIVSILFIIFMALEHILSIVLRTALVPMNFGWVGLGLYSGEMNTLISSKTSWEKKCMFGVPRQPVNIYPPQVHAWCCLKRKLWKENGIRQTGVQDLAILATMRQPKFILRDFGKEALKKKKNSRNPRSTHPTFLPVLGQVHKTIGRILWENEAERSTKGCQEQESAHFWFALSRPNVASHHSCLQVLEKNAFKRKAEIQDLPIQSSFFEVFEQEALKGK